MKKFNGFTLIELMIVVAIYRHPGRRPSRRQDSRTVRQVSEGLSLSGGTKAVMTSTSSSGTLPATNADSTDAINIPATC
ncbi:MAG: prepilin-type N-terminal cleavage/methylation domain-containing protein [Woeseiaceae bacterium]|nr:prepilin-type N-terminal cleavage/methylation domain-containing protein [Woeseiaceae bacterium]